MTGQSGRLLGAIRLTLNGRSLDTPDIQQSDDTFSTLLTDLAAALKSALDMTPFETLFTVPNMLVSLDGSIYLVKPLRRRFWLQSAALDDADRIVQGIEAVNDAEMARA